MSSRMTDFSSIATHKFLWPSGRQTLREGRPNNYQVFVKPDAVCTEKEIVAIRSLLNCFHDQSLRLPSIKAGSFFLSGDKVDIAGLDAIRDARSDHWRDLPGDALEFDCGTPPAVNFFRMDAIMNRLAALGIPCATHVDIGQGDYYFFGLWDRGLSPVAARDADAKAVADRYRTARTRRPTTEQEHDASEARSQRVRSYESELRSILPPAPKADTTRMPLLMRSGRSEGWVDTRRRL